MLPNQFQVPKSVIPGSCVPHKFARDYGDGEDAGGVEGNGEDAGGGDGLIWLYA